MAQKKKATAKKTTSKKAGAKTAPKKPAEVGQTRLEISIRPEKTVYIGCCDAAEWGTREQFERVEQNWISDDPPDFGGYENVPLFLACDNEEGYMVLGNKAGYWLPVQVTVKMGGKVVFDQAVTPDRSHGIVFRKTEPPFASDFTKVPVWMLEVIQDPTTDSQRIWPSVTRIVARDFRFDPSKLTIPYFPCPIDFEGRPVRPSALCNHRGLLYEGLDILDDIKCSGTSGWPNGEEDMNFFLLSSSGVTQEPDPSDIRLNLEDAQKGTVDVTAEELASLFVFKSLGDSSVVDGIVKGMVSIPGQDFRMGRCPVTQAQWEAVTGENPAAFYKDPNNPVCVSGDDCQMFLEKLNALPDVKASGLTFRLPTEDEWEFACRAGATGRYCKLDDGTEITEETLGEVAWFKDNSDGKVHPVGQKKGNAFGLYDVLGNVWEWTASEEGDDRIVCGGSRKHSARRCESSCRHWLSPSNHEWDVGFRLCASGRAASNDGSASRK